MSARCSSVVPLNAPLPEREAFEHRVSTSPGRSLQEGQPLSHATHGTFSELDPHRRLTLTHVIDFLPGVTPYESTMRMELFPSGNRVRMVVHLSPMHSPEFTKMQSMGFNSQLTKLDKRFATEVRQPA